MAVWITLAFVIGAIAGAVVGWLIGVDGASQAFAAEWLKRHPDEGDLTLSRDDD